MKRSIIWCVLLTLCFLCGCSGNNAGQTTNRPSTPETLPEQNVPMTSFPSNSGGTYKAPPFADAVFHETDEVDGIKLDLSATAEGYVAVSAKAEVKLKMQIKKDELTYTYNIASDGTPSIFPLQCGNGLYVFSVYENVTEKKFALKYSAEAEVVLADEFQPFLRPSDYVDYSESSACVKKAAELAEKAATELDVVREVFQYICDNVRYDKEKADKVEKGELPGYLPDPDETMSTGKGICFDYASLAAAMLRSQGIPTRVIFGYVSPNDLYHAWNMFYTDETGWVTVEYMVSEDTWNRLDLTFSANGADDTFVGDGGNYTDVFIY